MMCNEILFKNMDIEEIGDSGILVAKNKIWMPDKAIVHNSEIILPTKNIANSNILCVCNEILIPNTNTIYGGIKK